MLLKQVSRSFFLSIHYLPKEMREVVGTAYLLARATDTVADAEGIPPDKREALLCAMTTAIEGTAGKEEIRSLNEELSQCAGNLSLAGEMELLSRFGECLKVAFTFPAPQQKLIRNVLRTIIEGQRLDLTWFREHPRFSDEEQTLRYTYLVAGCVGEFWTRLGLLTLGKRFSKHDAETLVKQGIRYGQGLQLINILRDFEEDASRGRCYLPKDADLNTWRKTTRQLLGEGLSYADKLRGIRVRFTSLLPALLALKTLNALETSPPPAQGKIKITRHSVYRSCASCLFRSLFGRRN